MNLDRWQELKENLRRRFEVEEEKSEALVKDTPDGTVIQGSKEILAVKTPAGKIRLVCEIRPRILEKTYHYTHRQGAAATAEYKLSETEKTCKLRIFQWNEREADWEELDERNVAGML